MSNPVSPEHLKTLSQVIYSLENKAVPYLAIGGLAAIAWGADRPLYDIDLQIGEENMLSVRDLFSENIKHDLRHYKTDRWDIKQMVLEIKGIEVDICQAEDFYVISNGSYKPVVNCLSRPVLRSLGEMLVPTIPKEELIRYKSYLGRNVDLEDISALS